MPPDPSEARVPLPCPICKRPVEEAERNKPGNAFPFCSERCKLIDLGRWLGGKYQIPVVEKDESDTPIDPHR
jgi:endogenous inhibitor of DNA gyrase (YacG/DUF329 family)